MSKFSRQNFWILLIFLLAGVVLGGFLGEILGHNPSFRFLNYGKTFGFIKPFLIDLGILKIEFGFSIKFTIAGIIGIIISFFAYKKFIR